jgi:patatin-like phospholipase/acyl hydrolase
MADLTPLKGTRIWLSGSQPEGLDEVASARFSAFIARLGELIFRDGGTIIHGSHPTVAATLLSAAEQFQKGARGSRDCLVLAASKFFRHRYAPQLEDWKRNSIVHEVPTGIDEAESLERLRLWIVDRCDAIISVGGRWWKVNPAAAGIPQEFALARERGLPCFLLAGVSGAAAGYLQQFPSSIRDLRNGLSESENRALAGELDLDALANRVVEQLRRLPLVRGEPLGDSTFRILSLDGGGIKGTFTAAVLAAWEEVLERKHSGKLTDHFDLIAGTSTGGILALGLGMGLRARDILAFYEQRGPTVFPLTSLGRKFRYRLRQVFTAKYPQEALRGELGAAFASAPGKKMRDSACRLVIPAAHALTGSVHLFRTNHHPDVTAHAESRAVDVALATAAAPTYFSAATVDASSYVDGGVWANNPTLAALTEAVSRLHVPLNRVDILSIGTTAAPYSGRKTLEAGFAGWLKGGRIIELLMHAQAQGTIALANSLAGRPRILRVDLTLVPNEVSLDNIERIGNLKDYGRKVAQDEGTVADVMARFLNGIQVEDWRRY